MKKIILFTAFVLGTAAGFGQQLSSSSLMEMYGVLHNPATAGAKKTGSVGGSFKTQWAGMPGSPETGVLFGQTYFSKARIGLGGYLYSDVTGPTRRTGLQVAYAYHIPMAHEGSFSIGLEGRFAQYSFDRAKMTDALGSSDPVVSGDGQRLKGDAGVGVAYTTPVYSVGASVSQLIQSKLNLYEGMGNPSEEAKLYRHFYLHGQYSFDVDGTNKIIPHALLIYLPNAPTEVQAGARVEHRNLFWYGLTWRANQAWMISAGLRIHEKLNLAYSFDLYTTPLSIYDGGSNGHELMLRYDFLH
jgi:type IX secretion system PorP/SprF family membrane protein